jgi:cysteinyl-tRNA synthetase
MIYARIKGQQIQKVTNEDKEGSTQNNHIMISLYNTKTKSKEVFSPLTEGEVRIYSCGPTVYHYQHLGNMRAGVFADTLHRLFKESGFIVKHVINITDVGHNTDDGDDGEDKMEKGSRREGKSVYEIAKLYTDSYFQDLSLLGVTLSEYNFPRATENIPEQIALVKRLEEKGYTYILDDGVYFDTSRFPSYGDFARLDIEGLKSGARVEENKDKRNVTDFALWKFSPKNEKRQMEWDSPWGVGFPGWHIECSAMAMKYLGESFDIHTGGIEHVPVHHTNEIAQSECATGEPYVRYWMHNNHLIDTTGKMSKSSGDFLTVSTLTEKGFDPLAYRYFLLTAHYRKELSFSFEALTGAGTAYKKLCQFIAETKKDNQEGVVHKGYYEEAYDALSDDLGTPEAVAVLWTVIKDQTLEGVDKVATILAIDAFLGLSLKEKSVRQEPLTFPEEVKELLTKRQLARDNKDFQASDALRNELLSLGFEVKDTKDGQTVTKI